MIDHFRKRHDRMTKGVSIVSQGVVESVQTALTQVGQTRARQLRRSKSFITVEAAPSHSHASPH